MLLFMPLFWDRGIVAALQIPFCEPQEILGVCIRLKYFAGMMAHDLGEIFSSSLPAFPTALA